MRRLIPLLAIAGLAACSQEVPPSAMSDIPRRAPLLPPGSLVIALPGVPPVPRALTAELARGGPAICAPTVPARLDPVGEGQFRLVMQPPGFLVTRESILRRTGQGQPGAPELALDGANNGRCDYVIRTADRV